MTTPASSQLVCLLDVLGFESLLASLDLAALRTRYEALIEQVKSQTGGIDIAPLSRWRRRVGWAVVGNAHFSDSRLFWTGYGQIGLPGFTQLIADAVCFGLETALPLRGAIAAGEAILDSSTGVFLGEPLIEVARTEPAQQWIWFRSDPRSAIRVSGKASIYLNTVLPYKSHYKDASARHYLLELERIPALKPQNRPMSKDIVEHRQEQSVLGPGDVLHRR